jgi:hypothetical protein
MLRSGCCLVAMLLAVGLAPAGAAAIAPSEASPGDASIHRLGPDARSLRFEGEISSKSWAIYVTAAQAQSRARVRLAYTNTISVMPEVSTIRIWVNDAEVGKAQIAAASDPGSIDVELPKGLLTTGFNAVRIEVSQRHRVDCSLEATYELLTQIDPKTSGLTFPGAPDAGIATLDDLAAISPDETGAVTIKAVLPSDASPEAIDREMKAVEATAIRARIFRPNVEVVEAIDDQPGLYVLASTYADARAHGLGAYLDKVGSPGIVPSNTAGQVIVAVGAESAAAVDASIRKILPADGADGLIATRAAGLVLKSLNGYPISGSERIPFRDLGLRSEEFNGRLYRASFDLLLPPDFYPADYDKLTLSLSVGYAAGLSPQAQILVRVNDLEAGSMPMRNPRGDIFHDRPITVSFSAFRPGVNHVVIEAQTPAPQDVACDVPTLMNAEKRFALFDRSELVVPNFARIAKMPNLAVTMSSGFPYTDDRLSWLYLAHHDNDTIAAAASFLSRMAFVAGHTIGAHVTFDAQNLRSGSAILFGSIEDLGAGAVRPFSLNLQNMRRAWARPGAIDAANAALAATATAPGFEANADLYDKWAEGGQSAHANFGQTTSLRALYDRFINVHRSDFAWLRSPPSDISAPDRSTMMIVQARSPNGGSDTWTLVVSANSDELTRDVRGLIAPANWNAIEGRAAAFKPRAGAVNIDSAADVYFITTQRFSPTNFRLIAAGWLSSNVDYYALAFLIGGLIMGGLTTWTVRVFGERP